jgi:hypothetical protein
MIKLGPNRDASTEGAITVNVNVILPDRAMRLLEFVATGVQQLMKGQNMASQQFEALKAEVERNTTVDDSIKTLVESLAAQIQANKDDPAALQALADQLRTSSDSVVAVVNANTPSDTGGTGGTTTPTP